MKRVVLTGASGFVGSSCLAPLLARGYEVHAVSRTTSDSGTRPSLDWLPDGARVIWHEADLFDGQRIAALLSELTPTHLLHLAWVVTPGVFWASPLNRPWVDASLSLLASFGAAGGERVVMAGSCSEYARSDDPCVEGHTPLAATNVYSACKAALSIMLPAFAREHGVRSAAWARLFHLFGPREPVDRLVPSAIRTLLRDEPFACSHGRQLRDFLFIEDTAEALVSLLDSPVAGDVNIASGGPTTLQTLLCTIADQLDRRPLLNFGAREARADEPPTLTADVTRLAREVGWTPQVDLDEGVARTIAWWRREVDL